MVFDKTGSLAGTRRHDYLAFGEEWFAGMGGRTTNEGYVADGVRQKLTRKERDIETGLDYFLARYYSNVQGRFTSPDQILITPDRQLVPQLLNLYSYVGNNPLVYEDPTGLKRIKLGRSEADIQRDLDSVGESLAQENLSPEEFSDLMQQREELVTELEANQLVNAMLTRLDSIGFRNGLQISDFTLTTDPINDLPELFTGNNKLSPRRQKQLIANLNDGSNFAAVLRGSVSKDIFILQTVAR
ncbi:MAG TPA: RHS repeat-associated core domain-containing protein [Pyrinomonadaceae bacterium]|nr:RHS repeat-associated core domain-containing protein [Pyrinomonadaceae bacterium]